MAEELENIKKGAKETVEKVKDFVSEKSVSEESKLWGALSYLIMVLVPLVILLTEKKKEKFLAFHSFQSLILFGLFIIYLLFLGILSIMLDIVLPGSVWRLMSLLLVPLYLVPLLLCLLCAWNAYKGKLYALPLVGEIAMKAAKG
jgi:uncharacterized membrane protein